VISASPRKNSITQYAMKFVYEYTKTKEVEVDFINLSEDQIEYFRGSEVVYDEVTRNASQKIMESDVWLLGTRFTIPFLVQL
jgi:multimeric flavodoxin WrbA